MTGPVELTWELSGLATTAVQSEERARVSVVPFLSNVSHTLVVLSQDEDTNIPRIFVDIV